MGSPPWPRNTPRRSRGLCSKKGRGCTTRAPRWLKRKESYTHRPATRASRSHHVFQGNEDWLLAFEDLASRLLHGKPPGAIGFGKGPPLAGVRRPFHFKNVALERAEVEIPSSAKTSTRLPPACLNSPSQRSTPVGTHPVSSANSRRAATSAASPSSRSPLGTDHAPSFFFAQNGPPG